MKIIQTTMEYIKNPDTKTTYIEVSKETKEIFEKDYYLTTNNNTIKFFRNFGAKETAKRSNTVEGIKITKLTSISPDKQSKIVRAFKFSL